MMHKIRVEIPTYKKNEMKRLSQKIGIPLSSLLVMMIIETMRLPGLMPENEKKKNRVKDKELGMDSISITLEDSYYYNVLCPFFEKAKGYCFKDFVLDCYDMQKEKLDMIRTVHNPQYSEEKRMQTIEKNKNLTPSKIVVPLDKYLIIQENRFGIKMKNMIKYYTALHINEVLKKDPDSIDIFRTPDDFDDAEYKL